MKQYKTDQEILDAAKSGKKSCSSQPTGAAIAGLLSR